eukprot:Opistho-2@74588
MAARSAAGGDMTNVTPSVRVYLRLDPSQRPMMVVTDRHPATLDEVLELVRSAHVSISSSRKLACNSSVPPRDRFRSAAVYHPATKTYTSFDSAQSLMPAASGVAGQRVPPPQLVPFTAPSWKHKGTYDPKHKLSKFDEPSRPVHGWHASPRESILFCVRERTFRHFFPHEIFRLQGFPSSFLTVLAPTEQTKQLLVDIAGGETPSALAAFVVKQLVNAGQFADGGVLAVCAGGGCGGITGLFVDSERNDPPMDILIPTPVPPGVYQEIVIIQGEPGNKSNTAANLFTRNAEKLGVTNIKVCANDEALVRFRGRPPDVLLAKLDMRRNLPELVALVRTLRPRYVFFESQKFKGMHGRDFKSDMNPTQYFVKPISVTATKFGLPQVRKSTVILGCREMDDKNIINATAEAVRSQQSSTAATPTTSLVVEPVCPSTWPRYPFGHPESFAHKKMFLDVKTELTKACVGLKDHKRLTVVALPARSGGLLVCAANAQMPLTHFRVYRDAADTGDIAEQLNFNMAYLKEQLADARGLESTLLLPSHELPSDTVTDDKRIILLEEPDAELFTLAVAALNDGDVCVVSSKDADVQAIGFDNRYTVRSLSFGANRNVVTVRIASRT